MSRIDDRGQAHTLEAFAAAILIVVGLTFALQATAVTPLSASTSNQHLENQQRAVATDLLETSAANGDLRERPVLVPGHRQVRVVGQHDGPRRRHGVVAR